jgi:homoserine/homoserine lactone efflux protein
MDIALVMAFLAAQFSLSIIPGPAVLLVMGTAVSQGQRAAFAAALGVLAGNAVYIAASAGGLGVVLQAVPGALRVVNVVGAAYLVWLGVQALRSRPAAAAEPPSPPASGRPFRAALLLQLSNPKSILFFGAMLPQFVAHPGWPPALQMALLGLLAMVVELPILVGYGVMAGRVGAGRASASLWLSRAGGLILIGAGLLAASR